MKKYMFFLFGIMLFFSIALPQASQGADLRGCSKIASVYNNGKGNNRTKKLGGNYASIEINKLEDSHTLKVVPTSGNFKYVTLHARYSNGTWKTIYQGALKDFLVKQYFNNYKKDRNCTHINVSVNGAHEKYEPIACDADFYICEPVKETPPTPAKKEKPQKKSLKDMLK